MASSLGTRWLLLTALCCVLVSLSFCFTAYVFNLLPYLGVTRQAFIYHYMPALYYASLLLGLMIDGKMAPAVIKRNVTILVCVAVASYVFFSPWVYAFKSTFKEQAAMRWLRTWD